MWNILFHSTIWHKLIWILFKNLSIISFLSAWSKSQYHSLMAGHRATVEHFACVLEKDGGEGFGWFFLYSSDGRVIGSFSRRYIPWKHIIWIKLVTKLFFLSLRSLYHLKGLTTMSQSHRKKRKLHVTDVRKMYLLSTIYF